MTLTKKDEVLAEKSVAMSLCPQQILYGPALLVQPFFILIQYSCMIMETKCFNSSKIHSLILCVIDTVRVLESHQKMHLK